MAKISEPIAWVSAFAAVRFVALLAGIDFRFAKTRDRWMHLAPSRRETATIESGRCALSWPLGLFLIALVPATPAQTTSAGVTAGGDARSSSDRIVITGSRLARDINAESPAPMSVIRSEDLRAAGNLDASATLRELPALSSSSTIADSIERGAGGVGQAVLNLRQLGANRTLVLVDGRRHVSGVAGLQAVDVSTIPPALVERVEVLTGGASAVYGADAVTGVVNYVLKRNFEGLEFVAQTGKSSKHDGRTDSISATFGRNLDDDRGNVTFAAGYARESEVLLGNRQFAANNSLANNSTTYLNPARRFQKGDIVAATMPNFAGYYRVGGPGPHSSQIDFGNQIPTAAQFATLFPGQSPTPAEQSLMDRAAGAPLRVIGKKPVFAISANNGLVFRADLDFFNADINRNGINDCNESYVGWTGFGGGGCYVTTPDGGVRIFNDGLVSTNQNQFGGDGAVERTNETSLTPGSERLYAVGTGRFRLVGTTELYWDAKLTRTRSSSRNNYNTFFDSAYIATDNPWIPMALRADADEAGGLLISRDNTDFGPGISQAKRDTIRVVTGMRGELGSSLSYDASLNFGRTRVTDTFSSRVLADRFLAATDAVLLSDGSVVCRSDIDPSALASAPFLPEIEPGFFTFRPGDGQCRPANLFRGANSVSPESVAFFTRPTTDRFKLDQTVASVSVEGDTTGTFSLPGGAVSYAMGVEYRKERSRSTFSNEQLGILDDGTFIGDISSNVNLIFDDQVRQFNAAGSFDVTEVFGEARLPLLSGMPLAYELSLEAAARWANYSTIGKATTWNLAATWAPARDFRLRGSYGKAIRAPDIFELFSPRQAATFRPSDPCNISDLNARVAAGLPNAETRKSNCAISLTALGVDPSTYEDPLTARFAGTTGGNPNLRQERATTWTAGFVLQPSGAHGLTLSLDYYSIQIRDAIAAVTSQDIVNSCYDLATFPNQFCTLFDRRADGGFSSLQQARINFGRIEVSGVDLSAAYDLHVGGGRLSLRSTLNWTEKLNRFFDPVQTDRVNPGLGELGVPEWSAVNSVTWTPGRLSLTWRGQYIGKQAVASVIQIEDIATEFGPAGFADAMWVHGIAASYELHPGFELFGGVSNLTDQKPYVASSAYPVSGIGRTFYAGLRARF